jgi:glucokinase
MRIGIDLGGTNIAAGVVDEFDEIAYAVSEKTNATDDPYTLVNDIKKLIKKIIHHTDFQINSIGIGVPGIVNDDGLVLECVNLGWFDIDLKNLVQDMFNIPTYIANDATVACIAEAAIGSLKGVDNGVLLTLGTGVGGGFIVNGQVLRGPHGLASEVGHMVVGTGRYICNCGRCGCLETFASSTAIIKHAKSLLTDENVDETSEFYLNYKDNIDKVDGKAIFDYAKKNDPIAKIVIDDFSRYLAIGIVNIIIMIDPEVISLGGGLSNAGGYLLDLVKEKVQRERPYKKIPPPEIKIASLTNDAGIIGAANLNK